jgi:hypothetical protein
VLSFEEKLVYHEILKWRIKMFQVLLDLFRQRLAERQRDTIEQSRNSSSFVTICFAWFQIYMTRVSQDRQNETRICIETRDESYRSCAETREVGYATCCDWAPCSWACTFIVWITNVICVVWAWVVNAVCVAWSYVIYIARVSLGMVAVLGCVIWMLVVDIIFALIGGIARLIR